MKVKTLFIATIFSLFLSVSSIKASPTAASLQEKCTSNKEVEVALCVGYIRGWMDALDHIVITSPENNKTVLIVFADDITTTQVIHVFSKYIIDHPESENKQAGGVLVFALLEAKLLGFQPFVQDSQAH